MAKKKIDYNVTVEEKCLKHIKGFEDFSQYDKNRCLTANRFRVEALNLIPVIHPDIEI